MVVQISFDMPYPLGVEGSFSLRTGGQEFEVTLSTHHEESPKFPGMQAVENIAILHDATNILTHTKIVARYSPNDPTAVADPARFSNKVAELALLIANTLVSAARAAYGAYHLDHLYAPERIGRVEYSVAEISGVKSHAGFYDPMMGGITIRTPPRSGPSDTADFARILADGAPITVAERLYFDARRYLLRRENRMALANLVISFEVGLADSLSKIAVSRSNRTLEAKIAEATLGDLGTDLAKRTLGHSLEKRKYWGTAFSDAYIWLKAARNAVLHKAQMSVTVGGVSRDFTGQGELEALFGERDTLIRDIQDSTGRVLSGRPAKP